MAAFDFDTNFISVESQEEGSEFEVVSDAGRGTGMFIRLAGPDAERRKKAKERLTDALFSMNRLGAQITDGERSRKLAVLHMDDMVAATISWRYPEGFEGPPCTPENVRKIYGKHSTLLAQVMNAADDLKRFTKG